MGEGPFTPDRTPGESYEEGLILEERAPGGDPTSVGGIRYVDGSFRMKDSVGVLDPRTGGVGLSNATPADVDPSDGDPGTSGDASRADHKHDVVTAAATGLDADSSNTEGSASSVARSDHTHDLSTGAVSSQIPDQANAEGSSAALARADHVHQIPTATPVGLVPDGANSQGVASTFARSDHVHATPAGTPVGLAPDGSNAEGTSSDFARSDHVHATPAGIPVATTPDAGNSEGTSSDFARSDHVHDLPAAVAIELTDSSNTEGSASSVARSDHTHSHGSRAGGSLHSEATQSVAGFMSATDKTRLDTVWPFSSERQSAADDSVSASTSEDTWVQKLRLTTTSLPAGDYLLLWGYELGHEFGAEEINGRVQLDDTTDVQTFFQITPDPDDFYFEISGWKILTLGAGSHTVDIDYMQPNAGGPPREIRTKNARLYLWRVD